MKVSDTYGPQQVQVSNQKDTAAAKEAEQRRRLEQQDQAARQGGDKVDISSTSREVAKARETAAACRQTADNPAAQLGAAMGAGFLAGRDKLTLIASPAIASLGAWIEQLIAESTGKEGRGILPIDGEPPVEGRLDGRRRRVGAAPGTRGHPAGSRPLQG